MERKDDGGPAFPCTRVVEHFEGDRTTFVDGMSLRDWFAGKCPDEEMKKRIPATMGDIVKLLADLGWISNADATGAGYVWTKYQDEHMHRLRAWARYQYADAMLEARKQ